MLKEIKKVGPSHCDILHVLVIGEEVQVRAASGGLALHGLERNKCKLGLSNGVEWCCSEWNNAGGK